jgi:lipopolysaccharide biosynthesis protein
MHSSADLQAGAPDRGRTDEATGERRRLIAMYLPQFHPVPENDTWWGPGFTEWTNVVQARPLFKGHYQPHQPADLGYYDLRVPEVRQAQADMARAHNIHAFCYYHYWFSGRRILERPFNDVLRSREPRFPFCLCWANENWTRIWDGESRDVLLEQVYSEEDDRRHIRALFEAFVDERYVRVDGKPLFLVYRVSRLPHPARTTEIWREEARRHGVGDLYLVKVESLPGEDVDPATQGFDAAMEFQPSWARLGWPQHRTRLGALASTLGVYAKAFQRHKVYDYEEIVDRMLSFPSPSYLRFPCVTPMWDNSARKKAGATILRDSTPEKYERWLRTVLERFRPPSQDKNLIFINAWNEWAEGNHLEPDRRWGTAYLEATQRAMRASHPTINR